ncbi:hypothetical protein TNCV_5002211 [Trichonephila clavipes]|nr:hypothetical protein TNCV_5002211 [Trichonephila clavipes]
MLRDNMLQKMAERGLHSGYMDIIDETLLVQKGYLGLVFLRISRFKSVGDAGSLVPPTLVQFPLSGPRISSSDKCPIYLVPMHFHWAQFSKRLFGLGPEGPTHLPQVTFNHPLILFPMKMNSPKYDDLIDMFYLLTPVSPLPPTPVASPSHEPSKD